MLKKNSCLIILYSQVSEDPWREGLDEFRPPPYKIISLFTFEEGEVPFELVEPLYERFLKNMGRPSLTDFPSSGFSINLPTSLSPNRSGNPFTEGYPFGNFDNLDELSEFGLKVFNEFNLKEAYLLSAHDYNCAMERIRDVSQLKESFLVVGKKLGEQGAKREISSLWQRIFKD